MKQIKDVESLIAARVDPGMVTAGGVITEVSYEGGQVTLTAANGTVASYEPLAEVVVLGQATAEVLEQITQAGVPAASDLG